MIGGLAQARCLEKDSSGFPAYISPSSGWRYPVIGMGDTAGVWVGGTRLLG